MFASLAAYLRLAPASLAALPALARPFVKRALATPPACLRVAPVGRPRSRTVAAILLGAPLPLMAFSKRTTASAPAGYALDLSDINSPRARKPSAKAHAAGWGTL